MKRKSLTQLAMLALFANLVAVQPSSANESDLVLDFAGYIADKGLDVNNSPISDINNCALCHADYNSFSTPHQFAMDFMSAGKNKTAFTSIENLDSDGDGTPNGVEIEMGFFPGISCADLANGNPIKDWPANLNLADYVDPQKPGCVEPAPDIDVQPTALNFTTATTGTSKTMTTVIKNLGGADLTVTDLIFGPGSSADFILGGNVPALPAVIPPNGTAQVEVIYAPNDIGGDSGALIVVSNSPSEEDFPVSLAGEGVAPPNDCQIAMTPNGHNFGLVTVGQTVTQSVQVENQGSTTDCVVSAINLGPASSADFSVAPVSLPLTIGPGGNTQVDVSYTPGQPGDDTGTLRVVSNAINSPVSIALSGSGEGPPPPLAPDIAVNPLSVDFGAVIIGNTATMMTTLSNAGTAPLTIDSINLPAGSSFSHDASLPVTLAPATSMDLNIHFAPTSEGATGDTLTIMSDDPDEPEVPVVLSGVGQLPPPMECNIVVTPMALQFGMVPVNGTKTLDVSLSNTGTADCAVEYSLDGSSSPDFDLATTPLAALPAVLPPGGSLPVSLSYFPGETGDDTGMLNIASDDPDTGSVMVSLTGSGFMPNNGGILDVREFEADLNPGLSLLKSGGTRASGKAQVEFNETGTEAEVMLSLNRRDGKRRGGNGSDGMTVLGAALYCGAPGTGQELATVFDMSGEGGVPVSSRWSFKGMLHEGDAEIDTATTCGPTLYDIAMAMNNGEVYAVIHTDAGDFAGPLMPGEMDDDHDDGTDEDDDSEKPKTKVRKLFSR